MANRKTPKVRMACPSGRPIQLRYFCPIERKEIRISTGTRDQAEAEQQIRELEAKLILGIDAKPDAKRIMGSPQMPWEEFREQYRAIYLSGLRNASQADSESRLDIAERIIKPRTLGDLNDRDTLESLQAKMLAGEGRLNRKNGKPVVIRRSPHTVKSNMATVIAALNWACRRGWLPAVPIIDKIKTSKLRAMKGRPITTEEFERMLAKTPSVVGIEAADSWKYVLRGLWSSALRLDELMNVSWDDENAIRPVWHQGRHPVLFIPAALQKNDTEEAIPLLPWFEEVLLEIPEEVRSGWVFNPESLQSIVKRKPRHGRPNAEWVGKIISRIGKAAGVKVHSGDKASGRPEKFASAHDLRRSCAERLLDAGISPEAVTRVLRHASFETTRRHYAPGDVQRVAMQIRESLTAKADSDPPAPSQGRQSRSKAADTLQSR